MEQVKIYHEPGRYAGWPANYGIWSWENEIVVGFTVGYHDSGGGFHARDRSRPFVGMQARSLDGGQTWEVVDTPCQAPGGRGLSADEHMQTELGIGNPERQEHAPVPCPGVDFMHPDFALMCARSGLRAGAVSWFYTSHNRCQTWDGPYRLSSFDQTGIAARTDYLVFGPSDCLLFLTAAKSDGQEGHVFCARTRDGAISFDFVSWIGNEPAGFSIMPAHVLLPDGRILVAMRCRDRGQRDKGTEKNWSMSKRSLGTSLIVSRPCSRSSQKASRLGASGKRQLIPVIAIGSPPIRSCSSSFFLSSTARSLRRSDDIFAIC